MTDGLAAPPILVQSLCGTRITHVTHTPEAPAALELNQYPHRSLIFAELPFLKTDERIRRRFCIKGRV
jgi:hypothetical protein